MMKWYIFCFHLTVAHLLYANFETSRNQLCAQTKILFCFEGPEKFLGKDAKEEQNKKFEERKKETISSWILKDFAAFFIKTTSSFSRLRRNSGLLSWLTILKLVIWPFWFISAHWYFEYSLYLSFLRFLQPISLSFPKLDLKLKQNN